MTYDDVKKLFARKLNHLPYKRYKTGIRIEAGLHGGQEFLFRYDSGTNIAKIEPGSVWTFYLKIGSTEVGGKVLLRELVGKYSDVSVYSDKGSGYVNSLRFQYGKETTGYFPGLMFDAANRKVLNPQPDQKKVVDRAKTLLYTDKLREVIKTAKVAILLGAYDDASAKYGNYTSMAERFVVAVKNNETIDDDIYAQLIDAAVSSAVWKYGPASRPHWNYHLNRSELTPVTNWRNNIAASVERYLRRVFKDAYDAYKYVSI